MATSSNSFNRSFSIVTDSFGIDPLRDKLIPKITSIIHYTIHVVTQDERGAPDLISLREYKTEGLWWIIMAYNGIGRYQLIVEGLQLKIPDYSAVLSLMSQNSVRPDRIQRVVTI